MSVQPKTLAIMLLLLSELVVIPAQAQDYDLVILNGRVMYPESKLEAVRNEGVKDVWLANWCSRCNRELEEAAAMRFPSELA